MVKGSAILSRNLGSKEFKGILLSPRNRFDLSLFDVGPMGSRGNTVASPASIRTWRVGEFVWVTSMAIPGNAGKILHPAAIDAIVRT